MRPSCLEKQHRPNGIKVKMITGLFERNLCNRSEVSGISSICNIDVQARKSHSRCKLSMAFCGSAASKLTIVTRITLLPRPLRRSWIDLEVSFWHRESQRSRRCYPLLSMHYKSPADSLEILLAYYLDDRPALKTYITWHQ